MIYSLNSADIQYVNSNAISECANVPPYRPDFDTIPIHSKYFFTQLFSNSL